MSLKIRDGREGIDPTNDLPILGGMESRFFALPERVRETCLTYFSDLDQIETLIFSDFRGRTGKELFVSLLKCLNPAHPKVSRYWDKYGLFETSLTAAHLGGLQFDSSQEIFQCTQSPKRSRKNEAAPNVA